MTTLHTLPFATELWLPTYRPARGGDWELSLATLAGARGYWGDLYPVFDTAILRGLWDEMPNTWMSIVPVEIESQEIGIASSHGHTVVLGLGMGWCAANVALRDAVERVTVIERDPAVIAMIADLGVFEQLPAGARDKIRVVEADALEWRPDAPVDSVQADFWAKLLEPQKWDDVHRLHANIGAPSLYFWGQELELWRLICRDAGHEPDTLDRATLDRIVAATGLPLVMPDTPDMPDRIVAAARNWGPRDPDWWR